MIKKISKTSDFDIPYYVTDNKKVKKFYNWLPAKNINNIISDIYFWLISDQKISNITEARHISLNSNTVHIIQPQL